MTCLYVLRQLYVVKMDEVSLNTEPVGDDDADDFEVVGDCAMTEYVGQTGIIQNPLPPAVGMEFETYDDVYYFYNCYAKEQGFGVRVSNTWYRKSREKYRGKLSCSSAGFKKKSEANRPRPETRTGCPAMIKFRLMETKRWRIIEVELEHNHLLSPRSGKFYKSHKHIGIGTKRTLQLDSAEEVQKIRLFRTLIIDTEGIEKLQGLFEYEAIRAALHRAIYHSLRPEEFEAAWEDMIQRHGIKDHGWIQTLYEDRKRWAPVYLKEAYLSGVFSFLQNEVSTSYFEGYLDKNTPLKEFLDKYDQALRANYQLEALADMDSRNSSCIQKPRCYYEFQLSKLYTNEMLRKFQTEVEAMYSCYSTKHVSADGPITYIVKEEFEVGSNEKDSRAFDVLYNASDLEVLCVCGLFNCRGYLCRHILCVLNQSGMQEIPSQYILSRWRKDVKRSYVLDHSCSGIDIKNPVHRYDDLYKRIVQVVEEGRRSQDRYKVTLQALDEILNKLHLVEDHQVLNNNIAAEKPFVSLSTILLISEDRDRGMKFKAFLTENGVNLLEKRFLPALDKMGKVCHLFLTREKAYFLHNLLSGEGIQCVAQFHRETLFDDYRISSQNEDCIAFAIDISLLQRAVRSSVSICSEIGAAGSTANRLQIKLVKKLPPNCTQAMPFLTFETKGYKSAVIQDVPISKPLSRAQVLELQTALDMAQDLPPTLVQVPDLNQLQNFVDRMKHVGDLLNVSICKYGDLHLQISTTLITLGAEFRKLLVIGEKAVAPSEDRNLSAQTRSERAISRGDAQSVQVSVKHFSKSLQCHLAKPDCAFYGIAPQGACLTVIFQFFIPGSRQTDKSISLHCRLPVLDPGT
ncbi:hypothetical protein WN944_022379 [Citrus x changshan-huyou]|uniref:Protein FAR1-RELATED SEQUENCE n=1 Tax=Citrus x changshan-huyou TaxID=2935761 RepID=A0AAP0N1F7_9ROSI